MLGATLGAVVAKLLASFFGARELLLAASAAFAVGLLPTLWLERRTVAARGFDVPRVVSGLGSVRVGA